MHLYQLLYGIKTPRIKKSILQKSPSRGGMALPNLRFYYWAANIRALLYWMDNAEDPDTPKWVISENSSCNFTSLSALLCSKLPWEKSVSYYNSNPIVIQSVRIWNQFRRTFGFTDASLHAPVATNHIFAPSISDGIFNIWSKNGILSIRRLYIDNKSASFEQLVKKFNIPRTHSFRYLQLRSFVASISNCFPTHPPTSLLDLIFKMDTDSRQIIGRIYKLLILHNPAIKENSKSRWEGGLNEQIPEEIWNRIIYRIHSSSICQRHSVVQFKVVYRLYWSKVRLAKIRPDVQPTCDRCKQDPANLLHMFWTCPRLNQFWQSIFNTLSEILETPLDCSPYAALFGSLSG